MEIKNAMEEIVIQKVDDIMSTMGCCTCQRCRLDVVALVLNQFPAKYVATDQGRLLSKIDCLETKFNVKLVSEIVKAINKVTELPHH